MQVEINILAKKYAVAFLNIFSNEISDKNLEKWIELKKFFKKNRMIYIYLRIPSIPYLTKQKALVRISQALDLNRPITKMMLLLLDHNRIELFDFVLDKIILLYRKKVNSKLFKVSSSHDLTEREKEAVTEFIKSIWHGGVWTEFVKDEKLIAGLRIQSLTFLWERSIAKQLRNVKRSIFKQVGIW